MNKVKSYETKNEKLVNTKEDSIESGEGSVRINSLKLFSGINKSMY